MTDTPSPYTKDGNIVYLTKKVHDLSLNPVGTVVWGNDIVSPPGSTFSYSSEPKKVKAIDWPSGVGTKGMQLIDWGEANPSQKRVINVDPLDFDMFLDGSASMVMSVNAFDPKNMWFIPDWFLRDVRIRRTAQYTLNNFFMWETGGCRLGKYKRTPLYVVAQKDFGKLGLTPGQAYTIFKYAPPMHNVRIELVK